MSECKTCGGKGVVRKPAEEKMTKWYPDGVDYPCPECVLKLDMNRLWRISRLNTHERSATLEGLVEDYRPGMTSMKKAAQQVLDRKLPFLSLVGNPGTGKTSILHAITATFVRRGDVAVYLDWTELLQRIRDSFDARMDEPNTIRFDAMLRAPIVCMDEIDKANPTDWTMQMLHQFVDHRWKMAKANPDEMLITVFAMNREPLDEHIRSRVLDVKYQAVYTEDPDYRLVY